MQKKSSRRPSSLCRLCELASLQPAKRLRPVTIARVSVRHRLRRVSCTRGDWNERRRLLQDAGVETGICGEEAWLVLNQM